MAGHAQLKLVMTECSKTQIRLTGLIWLYCTALSLMTNYKVKRIRKARLVAYLLSGNDRILLFYLLSYTLIVPKVFHSFSTY